MYRKMLKVIGSSLLILLILSLFWTLAYFVSGILYTWIGWQPHDLVQQLLGSVLGFVLFGIVVSIVSPHFQRRQNVYFKELTDALHRISQGDFQVRVDPFGRRNPDDGPFNTIVLSINKMVANLQELDGMRQEFISNVSHEIQSPLTSITGFARAMTYEELPREVQLQYLQIIDAESTRLSKLSDDLLRLASLDSAHHPFHPENFRLDKQIQLHILAFEPQWLAKEIDIEVDLPEISITADKSLLSQIWVNLIQNALKFTPKGGIITVSLAQEDDRVVVRITDTGCGMSHEEQLRIFERFYKADKSRTGSTGGSGLGLSIVHKIVDMHQGSITVNSAPDEGTTFTVSLPIHVNSSPVN
ncbi:HAMP domain-containing sensor histidine kinase [Gorillibacterium massiliense]|uniref:sensor histidine kinase n=1 Tax=Gorillibacterium massiliense TaxID=1280390 RepID=UPI00307B1CD2